MVHTKKKFIKTFIEYIEANSTNAFVSLDEMQDWEWTSYYNMYKCGNSFEQMFDLMIYEVYGDILQTDGGVA